MITFITRLCLILGTLALAACTAFAQQYEIPWFKIAGGGGVQSTGGVYALSGTIGQHDASGPASNGLYSVTSGFWSFYAVQTPGAPTLIIRLTSTNTAQVSWPSPSVGFTLQMTTNLSPANWVTPPETLIDNGTLKFIIVNPPAGHRFFRLRSP
jgi:hypothetical protein